MKLIVILCIIICLGITYQITNNNNNTGKTSRSKLISNTESLLQKAFNSGKSENTLSTTDDTDSLEGKQREEEVEHEEKDHKPRKKTKSKAGKSRESEKENSLDDDLDSELETEKSNEGKDNKKRLIRLKDSDSDSKKREKDVTMQQSSSFTSSSSSSTSFTSSTVIMSSIKMQQTQKWKVLFKTIDRSYSCSAAEKAKVAKKKKEKEENQYLHTGLPWAKAGWNERRYGRGEVGYYFDYIDNAWQKRVAGMFKKTYAAAKTIPDDPAVDPYSIENQLKVYSSQGLAYKIPQEIFYEKTPDTARKMTEVLASINPKFNIGVFNQGITYAQLAKLMKEWKWVTAKMAGYADPARHILDKYDWDGNGRLDPREFIFYSIHENRSLLGDRQQHMNFYNEFVESVLEPFFAYADCNGDGFIQSEEIWFASQLLKGRHPVKYDIYKCDAKVTDSDSDYRTAATNDLVLKNMKAADGYLNKEEFYHGMLLGFWDRQTSPRGVGEGNEYNEKAYRWAGVPPNEGEIDIECEQIKMASNSIHSSLTPTRPTGLLMR